MRIKIEILLVAVVLFGCSQNESNKQVSQGKDIVNKTDIVSNQSNFINEIEDTSNNDSTENQKYLVTREELEPYEFTNEVKRINDEEIILPIDVKEIYGIMNPDFALLDFNKDGYDDLFFEYYELAGTGEKNVIDIYFYVPKNRQFSDTYFRIMNPTYFFDKCLITSYYYGGGGSAKKYQVINGKLELIESIEIDIKTIDLFEVSFWYSQKPFTDTLKVQDNMVRLPNEYKYRKIIKEANI